MSITFEVCTDSIEGALAAQQGGAHRIELCANLVEGGVTPSPGLIQLVRRHLTIPIHVLIRPRGADFCYTPLEFQVMQQDILFARASGAGGVVLGLLLPDGTVDIERTRALIDLSRPMTVTFHRAIDLCRDSAEALTTLIDLGIDRILTSGRQPTALQGADCIARLVRQSAGRIAIMAGGGIDPQTLPPLLATTGVTEVHFTARAASGSPMRYRSTSCYMGKPYQPDEYTLRATSPDLVRQIIQAAASI